MISKTNKRFRDAFQALPEPVKRHARQAYRLFRENPRHPSLQFKEVEGVASVYSVRIGLHAARCAYLAALSRNIAATSLSVAASKRNPVS